MKFIFHHKFLLFATKLFSSQKLSFLIANINFITFFFLFITFFFSIFPSSSSTITSNTKVTTIAVSWSSSKRVYSSMDPRPLHETKLWSLWPMPLTPVPLLILLPLTDRLVLRNKACPRSPNKFSSLNAKHSSNYWDSKEGWQGRKISMVFD